MISDTSAAPWQAASASLRQIVGRRSSASGISGDAARASCRTSSTAAMMPMASRAPATGMAASSMCWACSSDNSVVVTNRVKNNSPIGSGRQLDLSGIRFPSLRVSQTASSPTGTLIRNTDCQPNCWVR